MLFSGITRDDGPPCVKCHACRPGVGTAIKGASGNWHVLNICEQCLFRSVMGDEAFARAVAELDGKKYAPPPPPEPDYEPIHPTRIFDWERK